MDFSTIIAIITAGLGVSAAGTALQALVNKFFYAPQKEKTLQDRVDELTTSLREATTLISHIEVEISARSELATQLQADVDRYNKLAELKSSEVEAIAQVLRGELAKEGSRSFWKGVVINFVFFLLGAGASWYINVLTIPPK